MPFNLIEDDDLTPEDVMHTVDVALGFAEGKAPAPVLADRVVLMVFLKRSTRTRLSMEVAVGDLGGRCLYLDPDQSQLFNGETIADTARVVSGYCDLAVVRAADHQA